MNDIKTSEIIKGLEACLGNDNGCVDCPSRYHRDCTRELLRDSLELINGQEAEIMRLKKINNDLAAANEQLYNAGAKDFVNALMARSSHFEAGENFRYYITPQNVFDTILTELPGKSNDVVTCIDCIHKWFNNGNGVLLCTINNVPTVPSHTCKDARNRW